MCTDPERLFGHGEIVQPDADRDRRTAHHQCWFHTDRQGERPCTLGRQADVEPLVDDSTDRAQDIDAVQHEPRQREEERRACGGRGRITAVLSTRPPVAASKSSDQRSETLERAYAAVPPSALAPPGSIRRPLARFSNPEKSRRADVRDARPASNRGYAAGSGSMPNVSFTAIRSFCLHPRYRSVVWIETWPRRN